MDALQEPEKDFLIRRFDGVQPRDDGQPVAALSIAGDYQPKALRIQ